MSKRIGELVVVSVSEIVLHLKNRVSHHSQLSIDYQRRQSEVQPLVVMVMAALELVGV